VLVEVRTRDDVVEVKADGKWLPLSKGLAAMEPGIREWCRGHAAPAARIEAATRVPAAAVQRITAFLTGCGVQGVRTIVPDLKQR
jgi:hypothetical protein